MALFNGALGTSQGLGIALSARPETYANVAEANIQYGRAEADRKRKELEKQRAADDEKYSHLLDKIKVEGLDPIYQGQMQQKAANVFGKMMDYRKEHPNQDPTSYAPLNKEIQDALIYHSNALQATNALKEDYGLIAGGKHKLNDNVSEALKNNDYEGLKKALGGNEFYRRGAGLTSVEPSFDFLDFKKKAKDAYEKTTDVSESLDANGNLMRQTNTLYKDPIGNAKITLAAHPEAKDFLQQQYLNTSSAEKERLTKKALAPGGSGSAFLEYAAEDLYPQTKSSTTQVNNKSTNWSYNNGHASTSEYEAAYITTGDHQEIIIKPKKKDTFLPETTYKTEDPREPEVFGKFNRFIRDNKIGKDYLQIISKVQYEDDNGDIKTKEETKRVPFNNVNEGELRGQIGDFDFNKLLNQSPDKQKEAIKSSKAELTWAERQKMNKK